MTFENGHASFSQANGIRKSMPEIVDSLTLLIHLKAFQVSHRKFRASLFGQHLLLGTE